VGGPPRCLFYTGPRTEVPGLSCGAARLRPVRAPDEHASGMAPSDAPPAGAGDVDPGGLGPRVTAVFTAAEQAAEHILRMAREEVNDLRSSAEAEIEAFEAERRAEAEREARSIIDGARAEADSIRKEARDSANTIESAARRREQWINEGIRLMVERVEWGRRGLDEVVTRLSDLAVRPLPEIDEGGEGSAGDATGSASVAEQLRSPAPSESERGQDE